MGSASAMRRSLARAANFVSKFHISVAEAAAQNQGQVFPVMDGAYVTFATRAHVDGFLRRALSTLSDVFLAEEQIQHRFMAKAAVAFGPTIHGSKIPSEAVSPPVGATQHLKITDFSALDSVLMSAAMPDAYLLEATTAPFGVSIHASAMTGPSIAGLGRGYADPWFHWAGPDRTDFVGELLGHLAECRLVGDGIGYDSKRATSHFEQAQRYFSANRFCPQVAAVAREFGT